MGNKKNRARKPKNKQSQILTEWRILKSFGLENPSSSKQVKKYNLDKDSVLHSTSDKNSSVCSTSQDELILADTCYESSKADRSPASYVTGRRIVDIQHFLEEIKQISSHGEKYGCTLNNLILIKEIYRGLRSGFMFECNMCKITCVIWSEPEANGQMDLNTEAVAAVMTTGGGYTSLNQFMSGINVRCMNTKTYEEHHTKVSKAWEETALEEMRVAAEEEKRLAIERGDVDRDGVPLLTVVADGSWAKRSYRTNYNSLSGVAAIVGYFSRKVLYIGVKNKYCITCARSKSEVVKKHTCFKNWNNSSSSMETAVIVEGFLQSEEMYGAKYARLVADGDSSVYHNIIAVRPYNNITVEKIECRNHLLRNYSNKLREITTTSLRDRQSSTDRGSHLRMRRMIGSSVMRLRSAVTKAIQYRKSQGGSLVAKANDLKRDILNGPSHVFGEHGRCTELGYFCKGARANEKNHIPEMITCGVYPTLMSAVGTLAEQSKHLIQDVDSNRAEHYNSVIARLIGGKRINYCLKGSYQARCAAAVVSHNTRRAYYKLHKTMWKQSPGKYTKIFEERSQRKILLANQRKLSNPKPRRRLVLTNKDKDTKHYGPLAEKPDMDNETYQQKVKEHLSNLTKTDEDIQRLEELTIEQANSDLWREERRIRITASNFGTICNKKISTNSASIVSSLLYYYEKSSPAMHYGREHEPIAIEHLSKMLGKQIKKCGLFIDKKFPFLGATPDGLLDHDGIVEVKCPFLGKDLTPDEVITQKKGIVGSMFTMSGGEITIKKKHKYHFQIQGQLHITQREYCILAIWTPLGITTQHILRDDKFWKTEMETKLVDFYMNCVLPELLDPRKKRSMPLREPQSILDAQIAKKEKTVLARSLAL